VGHLNPEDGSMFFSEMLVSACLTAWCTALLNLNSHRHTWEFRLKQANVQDMRSL